MSTDKAVESTNPAPKEKLNTADRILESAIKLFAEKGFKETSMAELSR